MRPSWTRIARHRISRPGSACFSSAAVIARRSTTATVRRRIGLDEVFTALFSTVAFASAVADGNRKAARQQEWVTEIKNARSELSALKVDQEQRLSNISTAVRSSSSPRHDGLDDTNLQTWQDVFTWAEGEISERTALGFRAWKGIPLSVLRDASPAQIQDFLDNHRHCFPRFRGSDGQKVWDTASWPLHIKKVRTLEWSVARMALELMRHAPAYPEWSLPDQEETTEEVKLHMSISSTREFHPRLVYARSQLTRLQGGKKNDDYYHQFQSPEFPRYSVSQSDDPSTADNLNVKLHALLESSPRSPERITKLLPSICFYLLTSETPPDIHTYNLLLSGFAGEHRNDLIDYLLRSIVRTHLRPNEITLAETLRHYIRTRQCSRFDQYVDSMDGFGEGLGLASPRRDIPDLLKFQHRVRVTRRKTNGKVTDEYYDYSDLNKTDLLAMKREAVVKVYEKSRRNMEVYQTLIQGALSFHGMFEAMKHYRAMTSDGWLPNEEILWSILHRCTVDGDWNAGVATWRRLQNSCDGTSERGYVLMLQLCRKAKKEEFIEELLDHGIQRGVLPPNVFEMGWHESPRYEQTQDMLKGLGKAKEIWTLKQSLEDLLVKQRDTHEVSHEMLERVDLLTTKIKRSLQCPNHETVALLREARLIATLSHKYFDVDAMLQRSDDRILDITNELIEIKLSKNIQQIEIQLQTVASAMNQTIRNASSVFFSACVTSVEACFDRMSSSTTQLVKEFTALLFCINGKRLRVQFNAIATQTYLTRKEMSPFVASILSPLVADLKRESDHLQHRIHATSAGIKEVLTSLYGEKITFRKLDHHGHRWTYQGRAGDERRNRPDRTHQFNGRQVDRQMTSRAPNFSIRKYEIQRTATTIRALASTKACQADAVPITRYPTKGRPAITKVAITRKAVSTTAARSGYQLPNHAPHDTREPSIKLDVPKPWLAKEVSAAGNDRISAQIYRTRSVPITYIDLSQVHADPSIPYGPDHG